MKRLVKFNGKTYEVVALEMIGVDDDTQSLVLKLPDSEEEIRIIGDKVIDELLEKGEYHLNQEKKEKMLEVKLVVN